MLVAMLQAPSANAPADLQISSMDQLVHILYLGAILCPLAVMTAVAVQPWVPAADLLRDPIAVAMLTDDCCHAYQGFVSNLGVLVWWTASAASAFAAAVLFAARRRTEEFSFLVAAAGFTALLALDDLFLLHENVFPRLGVPDAVPMAFYAGLALAYLWCFRRQIFALDWAVFVAAGAALAASILIDQAFHSEADWRLILEDGAKLIGISLWAAFHLVAALHYTALTMAAGRSTANARLRRRADFTGR